MHFNCIMLTAIKIPCYHISRMLQANATCEQQHQHQSMYYTCMHVYINTYITSTICQTCPLDNLDQTNNNIDSSFATTIFFYASHVAFLTFESFSQNIL